MHHQHDKTQPGGFYLDSSTISKQDWKKSNTIQFNNTTNLHQIFKANKLIQKRTSSSQTEENYLLTQFLESPFQATPKISRLLRKNGLFINIKQIWILLDSVWTLQVSTLDFGLLQGNVKFCQIFEDLSNIKNNNNAKDFLKQCINKLYNLMTT